MITASTNEVLVPLLACGNEYILLYILCFTGWTLPLQGLFDSSLRHVPGEVVAVQLARR